MKKLITLLLAVTMLASLTACASAPAGLVIRETEAATEITVEVSEESTLPFETEEPEIPEPELLANVWDIMDNEGVEEIELLKGLEVYDIDTWQMISPFEEIKLYQRTIHETLRLGTIGDVTVAQFVTNPDNYQTDYDYSGDPVWNVRMEKSDALKNNTGIEIPEDAWYAEYTVIRPNGEATVVCYDWPIDGDPEDKSAPVKTVELYLAYFEDTQNLYSIYTDQAVYKWNGEYWDNNMYRMPQVVLSYIKADGADYYKYITDYDLKNRKGEVQYFRVKMPGENKVYQYEIGMTVKQWVKSKYNTDGWKLTTDAHGMYNICSADGKYQLSPDYYVFGVMYVLGANEASIRE